MTDRIFSSHEYQKEEKGRDNDWLYTYRLQQQRGGKPQADNLNIKRAPPRPELSRETTRSSSLQETKESLYPVPNGSEHRTPMYFTIKNEEDTDGTRFETGKKAVEQPTASCLQCRSGICVMNDSSHISCINCNRNSLYIRSQEH